MTVRLVRLFHGVCAMVKFVPKAHILGSLRNQPITWSKAMAELVDNSFDAGAKRVVIEYSNRVMSFEDDGRGASDIYAMVTLGHHLEFGGDGQRLGKYGIGAKDAMLCYGQDVLIETVRNRKLTRLHVDWEAVEKHEWEYPDCEISDTEKQSGTKITFPLRKGKNTPSQSAFDELSWIFAPAISNGLQIVRRKLGRSNALAPHKMPLLTDIVADTFEVNGKSVTIHIGILPDGAKVNGPFWVSYGHRNIERTSRGVGSYSAMRVAGTIVLGDGWTLSKHKDALTDPDEDALSEAIFVRIEHVLQKAATLSETLICDAMRAEIENNLNSLIDGTGGTRREKRDRGDTTGSRPPRHSGRKRRKAAKTTDASGSVDDSKPRKSSGFHFDWYEDEPQSIGRFDRGGCRVSLNLNNPFVASAKETANQHALLICAAALIADFDCRCDGRGNALLKCVYGNFADAVGSILIGFKGGSDDHNAA
jgi:hypothetical protein